MGECWVPGLTHRGELFALVSLIFGFVGTFAVGLGTEANGNQTLAWYGVGFFGMSAVGMGFSGLTWMAFGLDAENENVGSEGILRGLLLFALAIIIAGIAIWSVLHLQST